ncbi:hypothetical protein BCV69DRAFT_297490 [Microstroma glucosiphilum]|uniref:Elongator complex protein 5 n=1 Tax=Pseudomicrostroma glucosiphilum TaxID=1684307 RepID=A0A316UAD8_9BASI|nr:hypothetical protein BCV69DRAFT_297490 [Pseudomicrostroma glucosiphilum]PWN22190.1 hypothetical protein BCV69DRAFT_297490 [Pseudomicrostroma glucosiphilum]
MKAAPPSPLLSLLTGPSSSAASTLVHVKQTTLQSCAPLLSELVHAALNRSEKVIILTSGERRSLSFLATEAPRSVVVIAPNRSAEFEGTGYRTDGYWSELTRALSEASSSSRPTTLILESLDALLDDAADAADPARKVYRHLQRAASALPAYSRLVFVTSSPGGSLQPVLQTQLLSLISSPHFLKSQAQTESVPSAGPSSLRESSSTSGTSPPLLTVQVHPPALWRRLLKVYSTSLRPASTSSEAAQQLRSTYQKGSSEHLTAPRRLQRRDVSAARERGASSPAAELVDIFDWDARTTDPRLWSILAQLEATSDVTGDDVAGHAWFTDSGNDLLGEEIEAVRPARLREANDPAATPFDPVAARVTLADLLGPPASGASSKTSSSHNASSGVSHRSRTGWGLITSQYRLPGGKFGEEVFGCVCQLQRPGASETQAQPELLDSLKSRLRLVPLEMGDRRAAAESSRNGAMSREQKSGAGTSGGGAAPPPQRDHSSLVDSLPFKLSLTDEQRSRRGNVDLPFAPSDRIYEGLSSEQADTIGNGRRTGGGEEGEMGEMGLRRGTTGQSTIYFEPDSADEEDEEDPDEDLDF